MAMHGLKWMSTWPSVVFQLYIDLLLNYLVMVVIAKAAFNRSMYVITE